MNHQHATLRLLLGILGLVLFGAIAAYIIVYGLPGINYQTQNSGIKTSNSVAK